MTEVTEVVTPSTSDDAATTTAVCNGQASADSAASKRGIPPMKFIVSQIARLANGSAVK